MTIEEQLRESLARKVRHCDEITDERDKALRERDEARERANTLAINCESYFQDSCRMRKERDEARASVAEAFRRGAAAMREACARWMSEREGISQWVYDDALSALPIPEEP